MSSRPPSDARLGTGAQQVVHHVFRGQRKRKSQQIAVTDCDWQLLRPPPADPFTGLERLFQELYAMLAANVRFGTLLCSGMVGDVASVEARLRAKHEEISRSRLPYSASAHYPGGGGSGCVCERMSQGSCTSVTGAMRDSVLR